MRKQNTPVETEQELQTSDDFLFAVVVWLLFLSIAIVFAVSLFMTDASPLEFLTVPFALFLPFVFGKQAYEKRPRMVLRRVNFEHGEPTREKIQSLMELGRPEQAELGARALTRREPDNPVGWEALARSLMVQGKKEEAHEFAERSLRLDPDCINALQVRALTHRGLFRRKHAIVDLETALRLAPENVILLTNLAEEHLGLAGPVEMWSWVRPSWLTEHILVAERLVDAALNVDATDVDALGLRSRVKTFLAKNTEAAEAAFAAASASPDNAYTLYGLGQASMREGDVEAGAGYLVAATSRDPRLAKAVAFQLQNSSAGSFLSWCALVGGLAGGYASIFWLGSGRLALVSLGVFLSGLISWDLADRRLSKRIPDHLDDDVKRIRKAAGDALTSSIF